jgi:hypothetical protein
MFPMEQHAPALFPKHRMLAAGIVCLAAACAATLVPLVPHPGTILLASLLPGMTLMYLGLRGRDGSFDYAEAVLLYGILYSLYFGVGAIFLKFNPERLTSLSLYNYLDPALALAVVGYVALLAGYGFTFRHVRPPRWANLEPRGVIVYVLFGGMGLAGFLGGAMHATQVLSGSAFSPVVSMLGQFTSLFFFPWFLVWYAILSGRLQGLRALCLGAGFLAAAIMIVIVNVGQKGTPATLAAIPMIAVWYARGRFPLKTIATLVLIWILVVFPVYNTFRLQHRSIPTAERMERSVDTMTSWDAREFADRSIIAFFGRIAIIQAPAAVLRDAGRSVDFMYGKTLFLTPMSFLVPRFLWPDKPQFTLGHDFGRIFGLLSRADRQTYLAITTIGELYWNLHVPGVLAGMFVLGSLLGWIYRRYGQGFAIEPMRKAMYVMLLTVMLQGEGNIAGFVSGIVRTLIATLVILTLLRKLGSLQEIPRTGTGGGAAVDGSAGTVA